MVEYLQAKLVTEDEFTRALGAVGAIYFIRNKDLDCIKIGHSGDPWRRLIELQVGNSARLRLIGIVAADARIEAIVHQQFVDGRTSGEWFWDRGIITPWLLAMTYGEPLCRNVWRLRAGRAVWWSWDAASQRHVRHVAGEGSEE